MSSELRVPSLGESISEVQVGEWLKPEGSVVRKDENLVLIESEKATIEVPSPIQGVLRRILKQRGESARVGDLLAEIDPGESASASPGAPDPMASRPAGQGTQDPGEGTPARDESPESPKPAPAPVMPAAQRILAEAHLSAEGIAGSGRGGRVTKEDAMRAVAASRAVPPPSAPVPAAPAPARPPAGERREEAVPMSPLRRTVARRLVEAQSSMAMLTTFNEVDMSGVITLRKQFQDAFQARHGVKLGFMSFFVKAVIEALKDCPALNAEIRDAHIVYRHYYDIGVAIAGGKGLVVPVLRDAERLGFSDIEKAIADLGARAREGRIKPEELQGGTFTITNGGVFGSLLSTPIINPPQSGILGMHTIQERPVVLDGQIVARPMMYIALTYDHRIVDGREAVGFLRRVKEIIETPARMLLEA